MLVWLHVAEVNAVAMSREKQFFVESKFLASDQECEPSAPAAAAALAEACSRLWHDEGVLSARDRNGPLRAQSN